MRRQTPGLLAWWLSVAALGACAESSTPPGGAAWGLALEHLDAALMSVAGSAADDVYAVGANLSGKYRTPRAGVTGPLVLHHDGSGFRRIAVDVDAHLWWVHVATPAAVFLGGTGGTLLRGNAADGFDALQTPGTDTVYGIWGSADDLWIVGGDPDVSPGFVWRYDGQSVRDVTDLLPAQVQPVFKVFGRAPDDVWMVGADGLCLHWDGSAFTREDPGTERRLFTVHGASGADGEPGLVAVGGFGGGVIVEHDGTSWHDVTPAGAPQLFGVFAPGDGTAIAVGTEGAVMQRDPEQGWQAVETDLDLINPFHAVWVDPLGGVWAAGGDVVTPLLNDGMLLHRGADIATEVEGL